MRRTLLIILITIISLIVIYFLTKWTTPKDCQVPLNRMSKWCKDFIYPE